MDNTNVQVKDYSSCNVSKIRTVVTPSGVYVCPYHRGNAQMKIGDATKNKLSEIWSSQRKQQVIEGLDPKTHCRFHCIRHNSNKLIDKIVSGEEKRILEVGTANGGYKIYSLHFGIEKNKKHGLIK